MNLLSCVVHYGRSVDNLKISTRLPFSLKHRPGRGCHIESTDEPSFWFTSVDFLWTSPVCWRCRPTRSSFSLSRKQQPNEPRTNQASGSAKPFLAHPSPNNICLRQVQHDLLSLSLKPQTRLALESTDEPSFWFTSVDFLLCWFQFLSPELRPVQWIHGRTELLVQSVDFLCLPLYVATQLTLDQVSLDEPSLVHGPVGPGAASLPWPCCVCDLPIVFLSLWADGCSS